MNLLREIFQLGVLFRENQEMRESLYESKQEIESLKYALEDKQKSIKVIEAERKRAVEELKDKIRELQSEFLNIDPRLRDNLVSIASSTQ